MDITFLGTASVVPGAGHDTASAVINGKYLIDTGWYAAIKMRNYGFSPMDLSAVFLTHCHHDHYIGLPQVLFYLSMRRRERPDRPPLKIVGPADDLATVVELARALLQPGRFPDVDPPVELFPLEPGDAFEDDTLSVATTTSKHPVAGLGSRSTERESGATCAFTGDTAFLPSIAEHVRGVDLLVHEASFGGKPAPADNGSLHAGAPEAAEIARLGGVTRLALTHSTEDQQEPSLEAARAIFPNTFWPRDGETVSL